MLMDLASIPWVVWVVLATIILGLGIAWGQYRAAKVTPREEQRTEAAVRRQHLEDRAEERREAH
ncbi:MAG TPA: hypothetical protein VIN06_11185 [Devosia sp.]